MGNLPTVCYTRLHVHSKLYIAQSVSVHVYVHVTALGYMHLFVARQGLNV